MGAESNPYENAPLDPPHDPLPVIHWTQEVGPSLLEAIKAMVGFVVGVV